MVQRLSREWRSHIIRRTADSSASRHSDIRSGMSVRHSLACLPNNTPGCSSHESDILPRLPICHGDWNSSNSGIALPDVARSIWLHRLSVQGLLEGSNKGTDRCAHWASPRKHLIMHPSPRSKSIWTCLQRAIRHLGSSFDGEGAVACPLQGTSLSYSQGGRVPLPRTMRLPLGEAVSSSRPLHQRIPLACHLILDVFNDIIMSITVSFRLDIFVDWYSDPNGDRSLHGKCAPHDGDTFPFVGWIHSISILSRAQFLRFLLCGDCIGRAFPFPHAAPFTMGLRVGHRLHCKEENV